MRRFIRVPSFVLIALVAFIIAGGPTMAASDPVHAQWHEVHVAFEQLNGMTKQLCQDVSLVKTVMDQTTSADKQKVVDMLAAGDLPSWQSAVTYNTIRKDLQAKLDKAIRLSKATSNSQQGWEDLTKAGIIPTWAAPLEGGVPTLWKYTTTSPVYKSCWAGGFL